MIPIQEYMNARTSIYGKRWVNLQIPTPWQVAKWGLRQVGLGGKDRLTEGEFVVMANVEVCRSATSSDAWMTTKKLINIVGSSETSPSPPLQNSNNTVLPNLRSTDLPNLLPTDLYLHLR